MIPACHSGRSGNGAAERSQADSVTVTQARDPEVLWPVGPQGQVLSSFKLLLP